MWPDNDTYDFQLFEPEDAPVPTASSVPGTVCPRTHLCFQLCPRQILKRMSLHFLLEDQTRRKGII